MARSHITVPAATPQHRVPVSIRTTGSYGIEGDLPIHLVAQGMAVPDASGPVAYVALYEATGSASAVLSLADVIALRDKLSEIIAATAPAVRS